jgi:pimeloyl-ACP methyl ester carboxylesterase
MIRDVPEVQVSAGPIDYGDSGGEGRPIVFIGGLPHNGRLWGGVIAELRSQFRCLTPVQKATWERSAPDSRGQPSKGLSPKRKEVG